MSAYGYRDAYWNEGAYSVGALIDKKNSSEALIREGALFGRRALTRIVAVIVEIGTIA